MVGKVKDVQNDGETNGSGSEREVRNFLVMTE